MNKKVAIITGGGTGLGLGTAAKFCKEGYITIITGRRIEKLNEAKVVLGENCVPMQFDITKFDEIESWVTQVVSSYGRIDVLVNNAGINMKKAFTEVSIEEFQSILNTNTLGVFALSKEVVKQMEIQEGGSIINISSMAACYGIPYVIAYTASKAAIDGMTVAMAVELADKGIRVNAIAPGFIKTPMTAKALNSDPARKAKVFGRTPMGKMGEPEDIANAVFFLASNQSSFITGEIIRVDGGNAIGF